MMSVLECNGLNAAAKTPSIKPHVLSGEGDVKKPMVVSDRIDVDIDRGSVCQYLGYKDDVEPSARIESLLDEYIEGTRHLTEPAYSYIISDIERVEGSRTLVKGRIVFKSEVIARLLERCKKVAVFILTIGSRLEETAGRLADDGLIVEAYVLDAIGSSVAESLADVVQSKIRDVARAQGLCISRRFSPGYCDWDINQQRVLFRAMDGDSAGVCLSDMHMMAPQKSISGIIGIGLCDQGVESYNPCETCNKRNCPGRRL